MSTEDIMGVRRQSIKIADDERRVLVELYVRRRIPIEQYEECATDLGELVEEWNHLSSRNDQPNELLHYMRTQRKRGLWVRLEGKARPVQPRAKFSLEEIELLVEIYRDNFVLLGSGSDAIGYDPEAAALLAKQFAAESGRIVPASDLIAKLTALRKRGMLPKVGDHFATRDEDGFEDIDHIDDQNDQKETG